MPTRRRRLAGELLGPIEVQRTCSSRPRYHASGEQRLGLGGASRVAGVDEGVAGVFERPLGAVVVAR